MKTVIAGLGLFAGTFSAVFSEAQPLRSFPLSKVELKEGPFRQAAATDLRYVLSLSPDRLLYPFLREAGIQPKDSSYGNWENTGLDGHIAGHYLSALADMYALYKDPEMLRRLRYMVGWLDSCQRHHGDGYVGGIPGGRECWEKLAAGKLEVNSFSLNGKWVPWYNMHKLFAGLIDAWQIAGLTAAKEVVLKLGGWALRETASLSDDQMQQMLQCEQGGMNEVFAQLAEWTGDRRYLQLAIRFSQRKLLTPLEGGEDRLTGLHANTQIPKVVGFERIAEISGDSAWHHAAAFFWETVVRHRSISIGGNSVSEHFNPADDFSSMTETREGPETCNSYNMLRLTRDLFLQHPSAVYMDYYERTLYNHILSSQDPSGGFVYFTPIRPRHYRVYSSAQESFWCCVGTGMENHAKYGEMIYAHRGPDLYVNLFMASRLSWPERGLVLEQETLFPFERQTELTLRLRQPGSFALCFRRPGWLADSLPRVSVNGRPVRLTMGEGGYVVLRRQWRNGDRVRVELPMRLHSEVLPDHSAWVSFLYGPVVLAAATDSTDLKGLHADGSRMGHVASGPLYPLDEAPVIVTSDKEPANVLNLIDSNRLLFTLSGSVSPARYTGLQLRPFYQVQEARYVLYWPYTDVEGLAARERKTREQERARLLLDSLTLDRVTPGEQQPESDHHFQGEQTESGIHMDRHYRHARGWFSYELKNPGAAGRHLQVTYWGEDRDRAFDVLVDGKPLRSVELTGHGPHFYSESYDLSETTSASPILHVRFAAKPGSIAGGVYEIRLLR